MVDSATISKLPPPSALERVLKAPNVTPEDNEHPAHLQHLASSILHNLQFQHDWTSLVIHTHSSITNLPLPRPILSGLPPKRLYIHHDEQAEIIKAEPEAEKSVEQHTEQEWVLPTKVGEKWTLCRLAAVFDALDVVPRTDGDPHEDVKSFGQKWRGRNRHKRLLLATLHDDSTAVYYIMHDGIVKPRQN
jgi:tRNA-splicing endonuclease subunit Sen15